MPGRALYVMRSAQPFSAPPLASFVLFRFVYTRPESSAWPTSLAGYAAFSAGRMSLLVPVRIRTAGLTVLEPGPPPWPGRVTSA